MVTLVNRAKVNTATAGTGTITLGTAVDGYQTFAAAGVTNGDVVRYVIEDGAGWEIGTGTYTATGSTLTRTVSESSNGGAAISLGGDATIFVGLLASDVVQVSDVGVTVQAYDADIVSDAAYVHTDNNYTTAEKSKLAGVEAGATADQTAAQILTAVKTVDGAASGLDADLLDGLHGSYYYSPANAPDPTLTLNGDASGSATFTNLGNASIAVTVDKIDGVGFRNGESTSAISADSVAVNGMGYTSTGLLGQPDGALYSQAYSTSWVHQIYGDYRTGNMAVRGRNSGAWQSWKTVWTSGNDGAGSGLDADLLDGYQSADTSAASTVVRRNSPLVTSMHDCSAASTTAPTLAVNTL